MNYADEYKKWLKNTSQAEQKELETMAENEIKDAFYRKLEFGTGGLRGVMGLGTNRMNVYTVRCATQGLAAEIADCGAEYVKRGVVIAFDSRNNSKLFAQEAANVLCANGIKTYLFDDLRPTPELSFAVRHLNCARGIVITASHNPAEYNGYKVYGEDGGQIPPQVAENIIKYIDKTDIFEDIKLCENPKYISVGEDVDRAYIDAVKKEAFDIKIPQDFTVCYTPLHGAGNKPVRRVLKEIGVQNVFTVPEQELPNGDFPTVKSPNPENIEAFDIATKYAKEINADLVFGTDPDSDRIGVVVSTKDGFKVLNGNQTGMLLCEFILRKAKESGRLSPKHTIIKTIVTTEVAEKIAKEYGAETINVLTGFKFIGEKIKEFETGKEKEFLFGFEESYGYLKGTYARDKDAVVAAMLICQMAADYKQKGKNLYDGLNDVYAHFGKTISGLKTLTLKGADGAEKIKSMMENLRKNPPQKIGAHKVEKVLDYSDGIDGMPKSNVLKYFLEDGWFAVRPSGTEPKIKFYCEITAKNDDECENVMDEFIKSVE